MALLRAADCNAESTPLDVLFVAAVPLGNTSVRKRVLLLGLGGRPVRDAFGNAIEYRALFASASPRAATTALVGNGELLVGGLEDDFLHLPRKLAAAYRWVLRAEVPFAVLCKLDADTVIRIPTLWDRLLQPMGEVARLRFYAGFVPPPGSPRTVIRPTTSADEVRRAWKCSDWTPRGLDCLPYKLDAYRVSLAEFNRSAWPAFATGGAYLVGRHALNAMMRAPDPLVHLEDVSMGLRAEAAGVRATHVPSFVELLAPQGATPAAAVRALIHQKPETKPIAAVHRVSAEAAGRVRRLLQVQAKAPR